MFEEAPTEWDVPETSSRISGPMVIDTSWVGIAGVLQFEAPISGSNDSFFRLILWLYIINGENLFLGDFSLVIFLLAELY
jgi:hypothetical protein